jgi:monoamine oxidase
MPRTPLALQLQQLAAPPVTTRRQFIGAGLAAAAAVAYSPSRAFAAGEKVVIVGGGLAGLTCAYRLKRAGITAELHEASARLGGRCDTRYGAFADGQFVERGGELIDTSHLEIRHLSQELGLTEVNLHQAELNGTEPLYWFDGGAYTVAEAQADFNSVYQKLHKDVSAASYPTTYKISTERGRQLDRMTIVDWIEESVPGGMGSRFGQLLDVAYNIEFGAECGDQSALNLLYLLGYVGQGQLRLFGQSNEKYRIAGGNSRLVAALASRLSAGQIRTRSELVAIRARSGGGFDLTFAEDGARPTVSADRVVLALPFSILRRSVDYGRAGFGEVKRRAIEQLGMGSNTKLHVGFSSRVWRDRGNNGDTYSDRGYQTTWEVSRGQPGRSGVLVDYTGGNTANTFASGDPARHARTFLDRLEPVLPGVSRAWDGNVTVDYWRGYEWTRGAYSFYKPGQYQSFGGAEEEPSGRCFFAGEHTTQDFQGYLNGAVFSGERAAAEVLGSL